jgi:hypothetical protein
MDFVMHYRDPAELCAGGGYTWLAELVNTAGLPLEVIRIVHDRVMQIDALDYEEGHEEPLAWRSRWWGLEALMQPTIPSPAVTCAIVAIYPDGSWHHLAER